MDAGSFARRILEIEARSLLDRVAQLRPFALLVPMVGAAAPEPRASQAIEANLASGRRELSGGVRRFLRWLQEEGRAAPAHVMQARYAGLRIRFNAVLSDLDIFADALAQRAEVETGVWLAGLEALARDALALPGFYEPPPVLCYLDRGVGAAIRRARTRLPTGRANPVAVIRVPRERMIGAGIAASLVHEVGHQASALLDLAGTVRSELATAQRGAGELAPAWELWSRWSGEVLADLWAIGRLGICSIVGLMGVVSLPRAFVFRVSVDDPHPPPWLRVRIACAVGNELYPHDQWAKLGALWSQLYPLEGLDPRTAELIRRLDGMIPEVAARLVHLRPRSLRGRSLCEVLRDPGRQPARLEALFGAWRRSPARIREASPSFAFAVVGQARARGQIDPRLEGELLEGLITRWALRGAARARQPLPQTRTAQLRVLDVRQHLAVA